jgi:multidrug resistance efflux pump
MSLPDLPILSSDTRAVLDRAARELAELVRKPLLPEDFFAAYLKTTVAAVNGLGGAVWLRNDQGAHLYARENFAASGYHASQKQKKNLDRLLGAVFQEGTAYILAARQEDGFSTSGEGEVENETQYPFFFFPIQVEGRVLGVATVWLREAGDPKLYPDLLRFLLVTAQQAAAFLGNLQGHTVALRLSESGNMIRCLEDLVGVVEPKKIATLSVNRLQEFFRASRCSLFQRDLRGRWRLETTSNQAAIDHRSHLVRDLCALAALLAENPAARLFSREGAEADLGTALDLVGVSHGGAVLFNRRPGGDADGLLLIERFAATPFPAEALHHLEWAGRQVGQAFGGASAVQDGSVPVLSPVVRAARKALRIRSARFGAKILLPAAVVAFLLLMPWPLRIATDCLVLPQRISIVTAEADGRVVEVLAKEGDRVEAGQVLARLDDRDIATQLAVARHEVQRWESSIYSSLQHGQEIQRGLAEINLARAQVTIERLNYLQTKTEIRSPASGVVLTPSLAHREGETIMTGQQIAEVASQEVYEVQVFVRQQDVGLVLRELEAGHPVRVDFILHAFPHLRLSSVIDSPAMISQEAAVRDGMSYFVARAIFPVDSELQELLKPGYSGAAKLNLPERPAGAVLFRRFADFVRVRWTL